MTRPKRRPRPTDRRILKLLECVGAILDGLSDEEADRLYRGTLRRAKARAERKGKR